MYLRAAVRLVCAVIAVTAWGLAVSTGAALADHVPAGEIDALRAALAKSQDQQARRQADLDATVALLNAKSDQYDEVQAQAVVVGDQLTEADDEAAFLESVVSGYKTQLHDARVAREAACTPNSPHDTRCEDLRAEEAVLAADLRPKLAQARADLTDVNRRRAALFQSLVDLDRQSSDLIDEIFRLDGTAGLLGERIGQLTDRITALEQQIADATHADETRLSL